MGNRSPLFNLVATALATCLAVVAGGPAPDASAVQARSLPVILGEGGASAIPGHYIVELAHPPSGRAGATDMAGALGRHYHGRVERVWTNGLPGFSVAMSQTDARRMAADARVAYVEQDAQWTVAGTQENPPNWGLDRIDQRRPTVASDVRYNYPDSAGTGVHVYVVDTGIMKGHTDFGGRVTYGRNFVNDGQGPLDASDCGVDPSVNGTGHGTAVAGIIGGTQYGVAKNVQMIAVRVFDCQGTTATSSIEDGLDWAIGDITTRRGQGDWRAIINLSIAPRCVGGPCPAGSNKAITDQVNRAIAAGIPVVAAAGNDNQDACNDPVPAVLPAITVGAVDQSDARWVDTATHASNYGPCVDVWAPGAHIQTDWNRNSTDWNIFSGTSMAVPFVTGAIALLWALPDVPATATPEQLANQIVNTATAGVLSGLGTGSANLLLYTRAALASTGPSVALAREADGRLALFGISPETGLVFWRDQTAANSPSWGPWTHSVTTGWFSVGAQADGNQRIELDTLTGSQQVWHRQQAGQNSTDWLNWHQLDGLLVSVAATLRPNGRIEVFGANRQGQVFSRLQTSRGSADWQPWKQINLSGFLPMRAVSAETYADGRPVLFMVDSDGTVWRAMPTASANDDDFGSIGRMDDGHDIDIPIMSEVAAARNHSGALELIGTDGHGGIFHTTETGPGTFIWSPWVQLPGTKVLRHIAAETNLNGTICVVGVDNHGGIWQATQTGQDSASYGPWAPIDGQIRV